MVGMSTVRCQVEGKDRYGRSIATCFLGDVDLNESIVRAGLAWAYVQFSHRYVVAEAEARAAQRGIFADGVVAQPAWEWRRR